MTNSVYTRTASGKTKHRRKGERGPRFVQLFHWMINMPVWHSLSPRAVVAYLEFAKRYDGTNNGRLHLSARELAEAWDWSKDAAACAIRELVEKGFIEITRASGFNVKDRKRQAAEYRLTACFCDLTQRSASKTFTKWRSPEPKKKHFTVRKSGLYGPPQRTEAKNHSIKCLHGTPQQTVNALFFHFTVRPSGHLYI